VLLRHMQLDPGARVAFKTLTQYLVLAIGIVSMAGALGIHWDDLQWLVAALTFGLAFGLQEIFANFISGLILLFERPIRVGDIVTIGQTSGTVTKVRLRATLIRDFDKKELLVPNKEFITQRLVNWTLSDTVVRIKLPIAVTMGADAARVRSILEEAAKEAEDALEEPPARVLCTGIDEGVVRFELWLFTNERTNRPGLKDQMFCLIRSRFEEEGIEIAKPQRELFIHKNSDHDLK
jgi:potassium-dependent mechanosensitive channel